MLKELKRLFKRLIGKKEEPPKPPKPPEYPPEFEDAERQLREARQHLERARGYLPRRPRKAVHQDIGKFMKGSKHQHKWYRQSVKAHKKPEEDET